MSQLTKASVDGTANTASLEIYVDSVLVTTYSWNGTAFLLSERLTDVTLDRADLSGNVTDIEGWRDTCLRYCNVVIAFDPHELRVNDHTVNLRYRLEFGAVMAIDATINKTTGDIVFAARPALTLSGEQLDRFIRTLKMMLGQPVYGKPIYGWVVW